MPTQFKLHGRVARLANVLLVPLVLSVAFAPPAGAKEQEPRVESGAAFGSVEGLVTTADGRAVPGARVGLAGMAERA